ncbi:MAG: Hypothetical, related to broad specificity phosphatases COG0406 [uncultured Quadrisphaera sp.]|uniref:Hypothetical, related to broad specificity phosphatases COG0406 n=1 Tax=uncultured Quadrisphaera sp. TaxID=904978 RepID=A0A6J4P0D4_9ACTN|nr:MAG: Hypothetical, related to broad specificity phosphatases COG0406 [uncultured Quadrisphaera sp.]
MSLTDVHLLRHGEVHNPDGVLYGRLPGYHLSERGRAMARLVADHLRERGCDVAEVTASPLERAQETAAPVASAFGLPVGTDDRLLEAENSFQGHTVHAGTGRLWRPVFWWRYRNPFLPSWGESYASQHSRVLGAARDAALRVEGREAVLVSHQLPIWSARRHAQGDRLWHDPRSRECTLASLTTLTYDGDRMVGVAYAEPAAALLPGASTVAGA